MSKYLEHLEFNGTDILLRDAEARGLIQENTNEIASVKAKANLNEQKIGALTPRVTAAEEDIIALDGRLDTAEDDIDSLELHMSAAEDDIDSLEDRVTSLEGTVDSLEDRMDAAEGDIDALEGRMDAAEGDIDNLEDAVDQHADLIDGLSDDVTALEGRMDAVETKNDAQDDKLDELDRKIAASTYEAGIGIYFGQGVDHTNINVEDELITELHNATNKNIEQDTRLTNIENGTTKLPYGKALSITPNGNDQNLNLLDPNNNVLSSVQLPKSGTQLKYDDEGTLTNIDEATLGEGLEYDDTTDTINCTVEPGTKIFPLAAVTTPTRVNIIQGTAYDAWGDTYIEPNEIYLPDTSTTIDNATDYDTFLGTLSVGDLLTIDFTNVSSIIDNMSTSQNYIILQYQDYASGFISIVCTSTDIINHNYIITVEAYMQGSVMRFRLADIDMYNSLYLGTDFKVEDDTLKLAQPAEQFYHANFVGNGAQDGVYPAISADLTDNAKYHDGDEVIVDGWDNTIYPDYGRAEISGLNFPALATHRHFILKRYRTSDIGGQGQVSDWELLYARPQGVSGAYDSSWVDKEYLPTTALELIGGYGNFATLIAAADFSTDKPKYIPYDGSTATTPTHYAVAENDKKRAEIFFYNSYSLSYDRVKLYDGVTPYKPSFIAAIVDSNDPTVISTNLAPAIPNSDGSYSVSGNPLTTGYAIAVIYDKV